MLQLLLYRPFTYPLILALLVHLLLYRPFTYPLILALLVHLLSLVHLLHTILHTILIPITKIRQSKLDQTTQIINSNNNNNSSSRGHPQKIPNHVPTNKAPPSTSA